MRICICTDLPVFAACISMNADEDLDQTLDLLTGPRSAVGNVSGYRCVFDCRSRGREFDPGPILSWRLIMK